MGLENREKLIEIFNLKKYFKIRDNKVLRAVDDLSFDIYKYETLGIVGESGSGKTTLGRTIISLYEPTDGIIKFHGKEILLYGRDRLAKSFQMIFQDPDASLDPRMTAGEIIAEGLDIFRLYNSRKERQQRIYQLLEQVGLNREHANRFPHEFSGGQKQRIGIARAIAVEPEFIVCDEPISALDVSIQAQIVNLFKKLQEDKNLTFLFIAHDLSMVRYLSDRVGVMYLGKIVELVDSVILYEEPLHPYTKMLLEAVPKIENVGKRGKKGEIRDVRGEISINDLISEYHSCNFCKRCKYSTRICYEEVPQLQEVKPGHFVACHNIKKGS